MPTLTGADLLKLWDAGQDKRPLDRALALLCAARVAARCAPAADAPAVQEGLDELDVSTRDARLFRLRAELFGPTLAGIDACPHCGVDAEFTIDTTELGSMEAPFEPLRVGEQGVEVLFRLPSTGDLATVLGSGDHARDALVRRCILSAEQAGERVDTSALSASILTEIDRRMAEAAPAAEIRLRLICEGCGRSWDRLLDIGHFLWAEISAEAHRLMGEVDALARTYGWGEAEILGMSARRRRLYLELV